MPIILHHHVEGRVLAIERVQMVVFGMNSKEIKRRLRAYDTNSPEVEVKEGLVVWHQTAERKNTIAKLLTVFTS